MPPPLSPTMITRLPGLGQQWYTVYSINWSTRLMGFTKILTYLEPHCLEGTGPLNDVYCWNCENMVRNAKYWVWGGGRLDEGENFPFYPHSHVATPLYRPQGLYTGVKRSKLLQWHSQVTQGSYPLVIKRKKQEQTWLSCTEAGLMK